MELDPSNLWPIKRDPLLPDSPAVAAFNRLPLDTRIVNIRCALKMLNIEWKASKSLIYELCRRPGYSLQELKWVVDRINFESVEQRQKFLDMLLT
jgi:hypothetical protein